MNLPILDSSCKWNPVLCGLLGLASLMFSRFIYLVAYTGTSFLFMAEYLAAMNIHIEVFFEHLFSVYLYLGVEFLAEEPQTTFHRGYIIFNSHQQLLNIPVLSHPCQLLLTSFNKRNYSHPIEFEEVSHCCSDLHFPNDYVEHLFMCLLIIYVPALEKCLFKFFCTLLILLSFYCWILGVLYIFLILDSYRTYSLQVFSPKYVLFW